MSQLHDLTALEQALAVRRREVSPVELVDHYLGRIEQWDAALGAYVTVTADLARQQASAAELAVSEAVRAGTLDDLPVLHGVPVPVKDLNFVAGVPCRLGSVVYDLTPMSDDNVVVRLREGGVSFLGKTNTPEFGLPCYTESAVAPPARTPWDLERSAGGSSGGAAAAVAGGLAPVAHGSDGGGSIRIPASVCGLVGLKTSRGRISNGPLRDAPGDLPVNGPLARTVSDAAALLDVMAGEFPGDPFPGARPAPDGGFVAATERPPGRLRIGRYANPVIAEAVVAPECLAAYEAASLLLADLGHDVEDVPRPFGPEVVGTFENVWASLATLTPVLPQDEERLAPLTQWLRGRGRALTAPELMGVARVPPGAGPRGDLGDRRVRRHPHPDAGPAAGPRRRSAGRHRPGCRLRGAEALHAVHRDLQPHRSAGVVAAPALDRGRAPGRGAAGRSARGRGHPAVVGRPARAGRAVGAAPPELLVTADHGSHDAPDEVLRALAAAHAVTLEYWDWQGRPVEVSATTVRAVLGALGVDASSPDDRGRGPGRP